MARLGIIAAVLLAAHAVLVVSTLRRKSATIDEVSHLPAGISYWQKGAFEVYNHNPPLLKLLAALPVLALEAKVDYSKSWATNERRGRPADYLAFGWDFMYDNQARYQRIYFWARLPVLALSLLAGWVIFHWARELFGDAAGVVSLALWCFNPNVIAHAGVVTADLGAASLGFVATYAFWRHLKAPSLHRALIAGSLLGLAQLTKYSALILLPCWLAAWLVWLLMRRVGPGPTGADSASLRAIGLHAPLAALACLVVIHLGYLFGGTGTRLSAFPFRSRELTRPVERDAGAASAGAEAATAAARQRQNRFATSWIGSLPVPLPRAYVMGFDSLFLDAEFLPGVYLFGELREEGWWWYYLFALGVKSPLGVLSLTWFALTFAVFHARGRASWPDEIVLALPAAAILVALSLLTRAQLGVRYVLLLFPFWFVGLGRLGRIGETGGRLQVLLVAAAVAWDAGSCLRVHPDHMAYFNEAVGGPSQGHRYLLDSNLDWGQDLLELSRGVEAGRIPKTFGLAYFGRVDPGILPELGKGGAGGTASFYLPPPGREKDLRLHQVRPGGWLHLALEWDSGASGEGTGEAGWNISNEDLERLAWRCAGLAAGLSQEQSPAAEQGPRPGFYAISASFVMGYPFILRDPDGNLWYAEQDAYSYFRELEPVGRIGYSIFLYDVSVEEANGIRARLGYQRL